MSDIEQKKRFEEWLISSGFPRPIGLMLTSYPPQDGGYASREIQNMYCAWQAGLRQHEECMIECLDIDNVRDLFEQWAKGRDLTPDTWGVTAYVSPHVDNDFDVWRAAWNAFNARQEIK